MLKGFFRSITALKQLSNVRGQALVLYAVFIPTLFVLVGAGIDLGWYYLNVSRLQNAADAAVVAGAMKLAKDTEKFPNIEKISLVDKYPDNDPESNEYTEAGDIVAKEYVVKNLGENREIPETDSDGNPSTREIIVDNWSKGGNPEVTFTPSLYSEYDDFYYVVKLMESIEHLFMPGWFAPMDAKVTAVAMLKKKYIPYTPPTPPHIIPRDPGVGAEGELPEGTNILNEMYKLEDVTAIRNWEWQDWYKRSSVTYSQTVPVAALRGTTVKPKEDYKELTGKDVYGGKWNEFQNKGEGKKVRYKSGDHYRTETAKVEQGNKDQSGGNNTNNPWPSDEVDSLNLDFNPDLDSSKLSTKQFKEDWDIGYPTPEGKTYLNLQNQNHRSSLDDSRDEETFKLRIHSTFNFETPYPVRSKRDMTNNPEDALYVRIESEPIIELPFVKNQSAIHTVYSTVRQIIININQSNMNPNKRPLVFYYSGPEQIDPTIDENGIPLRLENGEPNPASSGKHKRDSQPLILNLNADARVILFAPNSPVVINGNGDNQRHKMQGFVIAKEFVQLKTKDDYKKESGKYLDEDGNEYFLKEDEHGNDMFIDKYGNVQTKPLNSSNVRDPDYIAKLKSDAGRTDYADKLRNRSYYMELKADPNYANCSEMPNNTDNIQDLNSEKIYILERAFKLKEGSYYDSFNIPELKRRIYIYLDNYMDPAKENSVDMFFTKYRSSWID